MAELTLIADVGRSLGSAASRRLRAEQKVPGVVYGLHQDPVSVSVPYSELRRVLTTEAGLNALIDLEVDGRSQLSIVKELQRHPVRDEVIHVDFLRIDPDQELEVDVRISLEGEARKVVEEDGMVDQTMFVLTVFAVPGAIPNELRIDVSALEVGDSIRVGDLELPEGVRTEVDPDDAVAVGTVTRSTMEALAEEEAAAEAAAAAEAEELEAREGEEGEGEPAEAADGGDDD